MLSSYGRRELDEVQVIGHCLMLVWTLVLVGGQWDLGVDEPVKYFLYLFDSVFPFAPPHIFCLLFCPYFPYLAHDTHNLICFLA